jgi:hypothetical protein
MDLKEALVAAEHIHREITDILHGEYPDVLRRVYEKLKC